MAGRKKDSVILNWEGKRNILPGAQSGSAKKIKTSEIVFPAGKTQTEGTFRPRILNRLIHGDNLDAISSLLNEGYGEKAALIYIDPPFASNADYYRKITVGGSKKTFTLKRLSFKDRYKKGDYLTMLYPRLMLMKRLLKEDGLIFVHCDWRINSHLRLILDEVFGEENFLNEIAWNYGGRGAKIISRQFPRNHDIIYVYGRTKKARLKKICIEKKMPVKEARAFGYKLDGKGRFFKTAPRGDYSDASIKKFRKEGRIYETRNGNIRIKYFLERTGGMVMDKKIVGDVWDDIPDSMHSPLKERTDYKTQKPELLLKRIIESATGEGDLVCDFFSGSGTTGVVAEKLKRRWLLCEINRSGIDTARARLIREGGSVFSIEKINGSGGENRLAALTLKRPEVRNISGKKAEVTVAIKNYRAPKDRALENMSKKDFPSLLDYWTIDWNHDGKVFKGQWHSLRGNGKKAAAVKKEATAVLDKGKRKIAVRAVDIFGNETEKIIELVCG